MSKKPASLTSDLLARKGEAEPSTIDPSARMTLSAGSGFSDDEGGGGQERQEPSMERDTEIRPIPPEPEIIYTAEETGSGGGKTRLIIAIVLGIIIVGGIFLAMSGGEKGEVAPVSPNLTSETPTMSEEPAAPAASQPEEEISPAEQLRAAAMGDHESTTETTSPAPAAPAPTETEAAPEAAAPAAPAAEAPAPVAATPEPAAPAAPVEAAKPAAPAPAVTPQAGGAYVVQLLALRDEAAAKAAWKKIAAKHKSILASHALDIEKADLGSKGVWYRVRAAGFSDKTAATRACNSLKAAGQDCIVKKR